MTNDDKICKQLEIIAKNLEEINKTLKYTLKSSTTNETLYDATEAIALTIINKQ